MSEQHTFYTVMDTTNTDKAYLFYFHDAGEELWVPHGKVVRVEIKNWWAEKYLGG